MSGTAWDSKSRAAAGSILDRLLIDDQDLQPPRHDNAVDSLLRSIRRNLDRVLNTHAGGAAANPLLGVSDFNDCNGSSRDTASQIIAVVETCIRRAEPRISAVRIEHISDSDSPLSLKFAVHCSIDVETIHEQIRIDMAMRDGRFHQTD